MSNKDLQRLIEPLSDIGQAAGRISLPARRNHFTQKVRVANCRTVYLSTNADASPRELFVRVKGKDCTSEIIGLYDVRRLPCR
jgi:hypothetical protein